MTAPPYYPRAAFAQRGMSQAELDYLDWIRRLAVRLSALEAVVGSYLLIPGGDFFLTPGGDRLALPGA